VIFGGFGQKKQSQFKANLGIMKQFDVKKAEFVLPGQTFYVGPDA
jgi:hypothetical protein